MLLATALTALTACDREAARQRELEAQLEAFRDEANLPASERALPTPLEGTPRLLVTKSHLVVDGDGEMHSRAITLSDPDWADGLRSRLSGAGALVVQANGDASARAVEQSVRIAREAGFDAIQVMMKGPDGAATLPLANLSACAAPSAEGDTPRETCEACPAALNDAIAPEGNLCAFPTFVWRSDGVYLRLDPATDSACAPALTPLDTSTRPDSPMGAWATAKGGACPGDVAGALAALRAADAGARLCTSAALAVPSEADWKEVAGAADVLVHELAFERVALVEGGDVGDPVCGSTYVFGDL